MQNSSPKARWMLDRDSLDRLLEAFHPDREKASHAYVALRERLTRFFEWNQVDIPQELADETLDRLARRLSLEQHEIYDPVEFAGGIARLLLREYWRKKDRQEMALAAMAESSSDLATRQVEAAREEERIATLELCLQALPASSRALIEAYYTGSGGAQIQQRQRLAEAYGISTNALRNRVMRIRGELERKYSGRNSGEQLSVREIDSGKTPH